MSLSSRFHVFFLLGFVLFHLPPPTHSLFRLYNVTRRLTNVVLRASFLNNQDDMSTVSIIRRRGYPVETHYVPTEDGYVLELHRIPHGRNATRNHNSDKYPVVVQHGNFQTSADWLMNDDDEALGFYLADNGYDVWLGNQRGNEYSMRHLSLPIHGRSFWNFSFHEMGMHDLPAVLNYVTKTSGKPKTHYISFSLGSTAFFAGMSKRPENSEKVGIGIAMGPSTFQTNFWHGWIQLVSPIVWFMQIFRRYAGDMPVLPQFVANLLHKILPVICHPKVDVFGVCMSVVQIGFGHDKGIISKERLYHISKVSPSSSPMKAFLHEMQLMGTGRFCEYDYGPSTNMEMYGSEHPPDYNLTNVRAPIALMIGPNDILAHKEDAITLSKKLPNLGNFHEVGDENWTHLCFSYGARSNVLVHDHVLLLLRKYDNT